MKRSSLVQLHASGGISAFVLILSFFSTSLIAELSGKSEWVLNAKTYIVWAIPLMLLAMPITAISGFKLAGHSRNPVVVRKKNRIRYIAVNGILLLSLAVYLYKMATQHRFDAWFLTLQLIELGLGLVNIALLGSMIRDGWQLSRRPTVG